MPELPEVETIGRALSEVLTGRRIERVDVFCPKLREPLDSLHDSRLPGKQVLNVRRRGRYLVVELEARLALLMHFGMSGALKLAPLAAPRAKHEHIIFDIGRGESLRFECPRRFSLVKLVDLSAAGAWPAALDKLGVEPLSAEFDVSYFMKHAQARKLAVKEFIMDNAVVTGVGNIYATEALFAAKISPLRSACRVEKKEAERLIGAIQEVLTQSIATGGTTFSDFRKLDGSTGQYVLELQVYGRRNEACPRCGTQLKAVTLGGRTSVYCPKCQK